MSADPSSPERNLRERGEARAIWLGRRAYGKMHDLQEKLVAARMEGAIGDTILLLEHTPVVTLGRSAKHDNVLFTPEVLAQRGVEVHETARGGDVTYHGPGQLVCYPILDLAPDRCDVRRYVRALADVMILFLRDHAVEAGTVDGMIGVWADKKAPSEWAGEAWAGEIAKVGAIGVRISRWITMHGFALNLTVDPGDFRWIVPCGIRDHAVTSLRALTGEAPSPRDAALRLAPHLAKGLSIPVASVQDHEQSEDESLADLLIFTAPSQEDRSGRTQTELGQRP